MWTECSYRICCHLPSCGLAIWVCAQSEPNLSSKLCSWSVFVQRASLEGATATRPFSLMHPPLRPLNWAESSYLQPSLSVIANRVAHLTCRFRRSVWVQVGDWAVRYTTRLLVKLTPKVQIFWLHLFPKGVAKRCSNFNFNFISIFSWF